MVNFQISNVEQKTGVMISYSLSEEAWQRFLKQNKKCVLSNRQLIFANSNSDREQGHTTASLDRIDNKRGYVKDNIQWVHKDINLAKQQLSNQEFISLCTEVHNTHNKILE